MSNRLDRHDDYLASLRRFAKESEERHALETGELRQMLLVLTENVAKLVKLMEAKPTRTKKKEG